MFRKNKVMLVCLGGICLLALSGCGDTENPLFNQKVFTVEKVAVGESSPDDTLNSFGTITYKTKNEVTAQVEGKVTEIYINEGDFIRKNQCIMQLQNVQLEIQRKQYENTLDSAKSALELAQTQLRDDKLSIESRIISLEKSALAIRQKQLEYDHAKNMHETKQQLFTVGGVTNQNLIEADLEERSSQTEIEVLKKQYEIDSLGLRDEDLTANGYIPSEDKEIKRSQLIELNTKSTLAKIHAATADVKNAEQSLALINRLISELTIRSPSDGIVVLKQFEAGDYVEANKPVISLINISSVYALFSIQEQDVVNFKIGSPLTIQIPSLDKTFNAEINEISPVADSQSGNFSVKVLLPNASASIKPGMFITCSIPQSTSKTFCKIPETALATKEGDKGTVFCIINNMVVLKKIVIHLEKDGFIWIKEGLSKTDTVIDKPSPFLKEGCKVE